MRKALAVALLLCAAPAAAQLPVNCSDGGTIHDDGTFETGAGWSIFASRGEYVMRIDPPAPNVPLETVCVCWLRDGTDGQINFNINVWASDGPEGRPGTLLGKLENVSASAVSTSNAKFYRYDLSSLGVIANGPVYIGPEWAPNDDEEFFVCMDEDGAKQPAYGGTSILADPPSSELGRVGFFPNYKKLGVRARFGESVGGCIPSDTAMCLANNRFKVEATYRTAQGQTGQAHVEKLTADTGYLWFFNESNVETVVKVLDACALNQRFWVFAGGLTDVEVQLTITDSETGTTKTYTNPISTAFKPIQDTAAFATCN